MKLNPVVIASSAIALSILGATPASAGARKPTYAEDVAPILYENCVTCHRPGQIAPMSLLTYEEVRPWARSIQKNVVSRTMPPWHAVPGHGEFANDRSLTEEEIEIIDRWVKRNAPLGDASLAPPVPTFPDDGWQLGTPDLVLTFDKVEMSAGGLDQFHDLVATIDMPEDRWVKAVEILPGNRKIVHHVILYQVSENEQGPQGWLGAWAAGMAPMVFPEGAGRVVKAQGRIVADMHYHPTDSPESDVTRAGLYFAKDEEVKKELINLWVANQTFEIPAGNSNYEVRSNYTFQQDSHIHALLPHMHYRGKDFVYTANYPDGKEEILLQVNDYDFNWQTNYQLEQPLAVPRGTRLECVAHFDNSADNPVNPDPNKNVRFGNESYDEMMIGFVDFTVDQGVRPETIEQALERVFAELKAKYPQDLYRVTLRESDEDDDESMESALYLPREGDGLWQIGIMGMLREANMKDIVWNANDFTGTVSISGFGTFPVEGTVSAEGAIIGRVNVNEQFHLTFEGKSEK